MYKHHEACKEQHETRKPEVEAGRAAKLNPAMRKTEKKLKERPLPPAGIARKNNGRPE